jgi:(1->4)-alpha-D-glucan 1-alpha-D-glucosylmutase
LTIPRATYRLQLGPGVGLDDAAALADYLAELGVSHLYASPFLQAASGSPHGYDVVDPTRVSEDLGGDAAHERLTEALRRHGLGVVLDVVPNHMGIGPRNRLWWDVLRNGASSPFAHFFDVDWDPPEPKLRDRILLPLLEDHYGRVLERGLLRLRVENGEVRLTYHEHAFPLAPRSLPLLLGPAAQVAGSAPLAELGRAFAALPEPPLEDAAGRRELGERLAPLDAELRRRLGADAALAGAVADMARRTEADPDALDELLERQAYRLAYWRAGIHELDYRRFFDVDTLVALRVEREEVFLHTHQRILSWLADGVLDGLRVDHVDGLRDPLGYLDRVRGAAPAAWVVVEKILGPEERLPRGWPVQGTTGYDFLSDVGGLLVDPAAEEPLTELHGELTGDHRSWREVAVAARRRALTELLAPDLERLTHLFVRVCESRRCFRDFTRHELREALAEVAAHMPVYRTYVQDGPPSAADSEHVEAALTGALRDRPRLDPELTTLVRAVLLAREGDGPEGRALRLRFQQLTGAVTAKALEDTAFYAWPRMAALNEVGGDPGRFGLAPADFHARNVRRQAEWPLGMLALSTHDTKRGEDVRARLYALTEVPEPWRAVVHSWVSRNEPRRDASRFPGRAAEYLLYQTLVGAWPISLERAAAYMEKAAREAKVHTSWLDPNAEYEAALAGFVRGAFDDDRLQSRLRAFVRRIEEAGWVNSAAQKLVQLTAPGVPDLYQGSELEALTLVDPDNRRPVDFALRRRLLARLRSGRPDLRRVWGERPRGLPKLWIVSEALRLRAERPDAFGAEAEYDPLLGEGPAAEHVFAFRRSEGVITVVPRLTLRLAERGGWRDTALELPPGRWKDRLTGAEHTGGAALPVARILDTFPVALLASE